MWLAEILNHNLGMLSGSEISMKTLREYDSVTLAVPVEASDVATFQKVTMQKGETGMVVLVYGDPEKPLAYEVEFYHPDRNISALATVEPADIL